MPISGLNPLVGDRLLPAVLAAVPIPAVLYPPSIPFGAGAFGLGDVKLLAGWASCSGASAPGGTTSVRSCGVVLLVLLVTRRVGRKSYVPFGPFLIIGALWAVLIRA